MATQAEIIRDNQQFVDDLNNPMRKAAAVADQANFTKLKLREEGFTRKIIPDERITPEELDIQWNSDAHIKVYFMEPDAPAAMTVPLNTLPMNLYLGTSRYPLVFSRQQTRRFQADVGELIGYPIDLRQIMADNALKELYTHEDERFLDAVDVAMGGSANAVNADGDIQWKEIPGGFNREEIVTAFQISPQLDARISPVKCLINNITAMEPMKWGREEAGSDLSSDLLFRGISALDFEGKEWIVTIKHELVGNNQMYMFATPDFMGHFGTLEDLTMHVDNEGPFIRYWYWQRTGIAFGNLLSFTRADFLS